MKIDDILNEWEKDSEIDRTELGTEALKIPKLHHKYFKIFAAERLRLRKIETELKSLKFDKYEFYTEGPNEDTPSHWKMPARGRILKGEVNNYIDSDKEIIEMNLKIGYQQEKIELLESIIKTLSNRGYQISAAIQWEKFKVGL